MNSQLIQIASSILISGAALLGPTLPAHAIAFLAPGVTGKYFDGYWAGDPTFFTSNAPAFSRLDSTINFSDAASGLGLDSWNFSGTPLQSNGEELFSVEWTGSLVVDSTENYTFRTLSDDGIAVFIDGIGVISNTSIHPPTFDTGTITLTPGVYPFMVYYGENFGVSVASLTWKLSASPDTSYQLVTTNSVSVPVPGPLPLLGVAAAFGASRRLRSRLNRASLGSSSSPDCPDQD